MQKVGCILIIWLFCLNSSLSMAKPVEVGDVKWERDYGSAQLKSAESGKPIFLFFQEVPGCAGCQKFGQNVMTNPLLVEAIETLFIPVLVYNNQSGGEDEKLLKKFNEPAWNYQVIRFINSGGEDIIPRKDKVWTLSSLANRMVKALELEKREVPVYLRNLVLERNVGSHAEVAFAMYCFWTGEMEIGKVPGVISTEAGWYDGHEVTRVVYDTTQVSLEELHTKASQKKCATKMYSSINDTYRVAKESDQKKQISKWAAIHKVPGLTPMQKTKLNSFIVSDKEKALSFLSPRQYTTLSRM